MAVLSRPCDDDPDAHAGWGTATGLLMEAGQSQDPFLITYRWHYIRWLGVTKLHDSGTLRSSNNCCCLWPGVTGYATLAVVASSNSTSRSCFRARRGRDWRRCVACAICRGGLGGSYCLP